MTKCFEVFVILGLLVFPVIPGLNPGIQNDNKANLFDLDCRVKPGNDKKETSPGMTKEKKSPAMTKKIKRPAKTKEKGRQ